MEGRNNRILEIDSLAIYFGGLKAIDGVSPVSYTHLTLPTTMFV